MFCPHVVIVILALALLALGLLLAIVSAFDHTGRLVQNLFSVFGLNEALSILLLLALFHRVEAPHELLRQLSGQKMICFPQSFASSEAPSDLIVTFSHIVESMSTCVCHLNEIELFVSIIKNYAEPL